MKHVSWLDNDLNGKRWFACGAIALGLLGCASGEAAQKPAAHPSAAAAPAAAAQPAVAAKPTICDVGNTEAEVADEILAQSGRGLVWLVVPGPDRKERAKRGGAEVKAARA